MNIALILLGIFVVILIWAAGYFYGHEGGWKEGFEEGGKAAYDILKHEDLTKYNELGEDNDN